MNLLTHAIKRHPAYLSSRPFYRRYPRKSRTRLSWIDARGAADFEIGAFFSRIPKAANSFVLLELYKLRTSAQMIQQLVKKEFISPSNMTAEQVAQFEKLYKFTFVRNPYARTLSAYLDKIIRLEKPIKRIARDRLPSFEEFCDYLDDGGLHQNIHWAPQTSVILLPVEKFDMIGKIEHLDTDLPKALSHLRDLTGRTTPADFAPGGSRSGFFRTPKADDKAMDQYYTPSTTKIVTRLYADDLAAFGYPTR